MEMVKISRLASPICWFRDFIGQECPVLEVFEKTGYIKIRVIAKEEGFEPYPLEGWIDPIYVNKIKE